MTLTEDIRAMMAGPLGCSAEGPDGCVRGFFDREDVEVSGFTDMPRNLSRLDKHNVLRIVSEDMGTIERGSLVSVPEQMTHPVERSYKVQDIRDDEDGLVTKLWLVASS